MVFELKLFNKILNALYKSGALKSLCLIGSWAQVIYKANIDSLIPGARTLDLDFLTAQRRQSGPVSIKQLGITAQQVGGLEYLEQNIISMKYNKLEINN